MQTGSNLGASYVCICQSYFHGACIIVSYLFSDCPKAWAHICQSSTEFLKNQLGYQLSYDLFHVQKVMGSISVPRNTDSHCFMDGVSSAEVGATRWQPWRVESKHLSKKSRREWVLAQLDEDITPPPTGNNHWTSQDNFNTYVCILYAYTYIHAYIFLNCRPQ